MVAESLSKSKPGCWGFFCIKNSSRIKEPFSLFAGGFFSGISKLIWGAGANLGLFSLTGVTLACWSESGFSGDSSFSVSSRQIVPATDWHYDYANSCDYGYDCDCDSDWGCGCDCDYDWGSCCRRSGASWRCSEPGALICAWAADPLGPPNRCCTPVYWGAAWNGMRWYFDFGEGFLQGILAYQRMLRRLK